MAKKAKQSNQNTSTPNYEPSYLKALNSTYAADKEGQTFVTSSKKPSSEAKISPAVDEEMNEQIIQDIMKGRGVSREEAEAILANPL